jgi:hypothetical protein
VNSFGWPVTLTPALFPLNLSDKHLKCDLACGFKSVAAQGGCAGDCAKARMRARGDETGTKWAVAEPLVQFPRLPDGGVSSAVQHAGGAKRSTVWILRTRDSGGSCRRNVRRIRR